MSKRADQPHALHSIDCKAPDTAIDVFSATKTNAVLFAVSAGCAFFAHHVFAYTMVVLGQRLSGSTATSGTVYFLIFLPVVALMLFAGVIVDIWSRQRILIVSMLWTSAVMGLAVLLLRTGAVDEGRYRPLFAVALAYGISGSFVTPARLALVSNVSGGRTAERLVVLTNVLQFVAMGVGPGLAGWLISRGSWEVAFAVCGALALGSALSAWALNEVEPQVLGKQRPIWAELRAGFRVLSADRRLMHLFGTMSVLCLCLLGPYQVLIPELGRDVLLLSETEKGLLMFPCGLGLLLGGGIAGAVLHLPNRGRLLACCTGLAALAFGSAALNSAFPFTAAMLLALGLFGGLAGGLTSATLQTFAPEPFRGRLLSIYSWIIVGLSGLGGLLFGAVTEATEVRVAVVAAAITAVIATGWALLAWRAVRY